MRKRNRIEQLQDGLHHHLHLQDATLCAAIRTQSRAESAVEVELLAGEERKFKTPSSAGRAGPAILLSYSSR